jgi:hypothetical protein
MANPRKIRLQPLRNPGQSLDEQIENVVLDEFLPYYLVAALLWVMALVEWWGQKFHVSRNPILYVLFAAVASLLCIVKFLGARRRVRRLRKGRDGEREVAEILDDLKRYGAQVLHDIPGEKGNVDHVVISTRGVFVVETKAWTKPDRVWQMDFDGKQVHIPNQAPDPAPIIQCLAEAASIKRLLRDSTSQDFPVRGVVVFLEWYVKHTPSARGSDIWVLNPKQLAGWIRQEPENLSEADVAMATLHLKQYVKKLAA